MTFFNGKILLGLNDLGNFITKTRIIRVNLTRKYYFSHFTFNAVCFLPFLCNFYEIYESKSQHTPKIVSKIFFKKGFHRLHSHQFSIFFLHILDFIVIIIKTKSIKQNKKYILITQLYCRIIFFFLLLNYNNNICILISYLFIFILRAVLTIAL